MLGASLKKPIAATIQKKRTPETATSTVTSPGNCRLNHLISYIRLAFLPLLCYLHFSLTIIFIVVRRLLFSSLLLLYYDTFVYCIIRTLQNITTQQKQTQRRGWIDSLTFWLPTYTIIFSRFFVISNCCLLWLYEH